MNSGLDYKYIKTIKYKNLFNWSFKYTINDSFKYNQSYELVNIGEFLKRNKTIVEIKDDNIYKRITIKLYGKGVLVRDKEQGKNIGTKKQFITRQGQFILSRIDARNGAFGLVTNECDNGVITNDFWTFDIDTKIINPEFFVLLTSTKEFAEYCQNASSGTTNRQRISEETFLQIKVPLPSLDTQKAIVENYNKKNIIANQQETKAQLLDLQAEKYIFNELGLNIIKFKKGNSFINFIKFSDISLWGVDKMLGGDRFKSSKFKLHSINTNPQLYSELFRGKSPKYEDKSNTYILNQKCIRWNYIERKHVKSVSKLWLNTIDEKYFTKEGDILINSTGEGTIGRASYIEKNNEGLLYDSHILLIRLNQRLINPIYFTILFNGTFGQEQINFIKSAQSTKQTELGIDNLKKIKFPIPELDLQNKIVEKYIKMETNIKTLKTKSEFNKGLARKEFEKELFE